jgi:hypothetical protein
MFRTGMSGKLNHTRQMLSKVNINDNWEWNDYKDGFQYTTDYVFKTKRYPLRKDGKVVGSIDESNSYELTETDKKELTKLNMKF